MLSDDDGGTEETELLEDEAVADTEGPREDGVTRVNAERRLSWETTEVVEVVVICEVLAEVVVNVEDLYFGVSGVSGGGDGVMIVSHT